MPEFATSRTGGPPPPKGAHATDAMLMRAVAAGDRAAFERVYEAHQPRVFRLAYGVLLDRDEAREAAQEAFLKLHEAAGRWEPNAALGTWLYRVVLNHCLSLKRRLLRFGRGAPPPFARPSPELAAVLGEAVGIVERSLGALPLKMRLRYDERDGAIAVGCLGAAEAAAAPDSRLERRVSVEQRGASARAVLEVVAKAAGLAGLDFHAKEEPKVTLLLENARLSTVLAAIADGTSRSPWKGIGSWLRGSDASRWSQAQFAPAHGLTRPSCRSPSSARRAFFPAAHARRQTRRQGSPCRRSRRVQGR
jgi:hypothetical protein